MILFSSPQHRRTSTAGLAAVALAVALLATLMAAPAAANHRPGHPNPCEGAVRASEVFADYTRAREVHRASIDCALYRAITNGAGTNGDGEQVYRPRRDVTRAQMAQFIVNTLVAAGYDQALPDGGGANRFDDIGGNFARVAINRLADAGIVSGTDENSYSPSDGIRRQQMASFLVQAYNWALNPDVRGDDVDRFTDVPDSNVHKANIENGADAGLFQGTSQTTFAPRVVVVRDQMATFLVTLLRHVYDEARAPEPYTATITVDDTTVEAGSDVTGEVTGANITSVSLRGCGISSTPLDDDDPVAGGIQFSQRIPAKRDPGECDLTFTVTFNNGAEAQSKQPMTVTAPNASNVTLEDTTVAAGDEVTGQISGTDVTRASLSGCSFVSEEVNDTDSNTAGIQFSEVLSRYQAPGDCTLNFRVTYTDGRTSDETAELTVEPASGVTTRPELVAAQILSTTSPSDATDDDPAGTVVRYTFDEEISAAPSADSFAVYAEDGARTAGGGTPRIGSNATRVIVTFPTITTASAAQSLTTAVVDAGAVTDAQSQTNPIGAVTLRSGQAPSTGGPDLVGATIVRGSSSAGDFATVTYIFDEDIAAAGADAARFLIYLANGTQLTCASSGFSVGTSGTQRRQATCQTFTTADGTAATAAQVASAVLATVNDGAVDDREAGTAMNPEGAVATTGGTGTPRQ